MLAFALLHSMAAAVPVAMGSFELCNTRTSDARLLAWIDANWMSNASDTKMRQGRVRTFSPGALPNLVRSDYAHLGVKGLLETMVAAFKKFTVHPPLKSDLQGDVTQLDLTLRNRERAFWLSHWFGVWLGEELMARKGEDITALIRGLAVCSPPFEFWSVSHGMSWHYVAMRLPFASLVQTLPDISFRLCFRDLKFYTDCFHGVGHGIMHAYIIDRTGASYGVDEQFYQVKDLQPQDYDAGMTLCSLFELEEAAGCADGVSHSFFNYHADEEWPRDWLWYCAERLWPAFCYRSIFQYGPLSLFNISKVGLSTRLEWLTVVGVKVPAFMQTIVGLRSMCLLLPAEVQASCIWGLVSSDWKYYVSSARSGFTGVNRNAMVPALTVDLNTVVEFCSVEGVLKSPRVLDTCLLHLYDTAWRRYEIDVVRRTPTARLARTKAHRSIFAAADALCRPRADCRGCVCQGKKKIKPTLTPLIPSCAAKFSRYGAKCRVGVNDVVRGKKPQWRVAEPPQQLTPYARIHTPFPPLSSPPSPSGAKKFVVTSCDRALCPYRISNGTALLASNEAVRAQHRPDGH